MSVRADLRTADGGRTVAVGFGGAEALGQISLEFHCPPPLAANAAANEWKPRGTAPPAAHSNDDVYWKIGLTLPDVRAARAALVAAGVDVSRPQQFLDVGFLCHTRDVAGFAIELLQHTFEKNFATVTPSPSRPLRQDPVRVGQVTLRISDAEKSLRFYRDTLKMKLLSIQDVVQYGFTLYFLGFTSDVPPSSPDLHSVDNREWLWQRPYTTLELQHRPGRPPIRFDSRREDAAAAAGPGPGGFKGLAVALETADRLDVAKIAGVVKKAENVWLLRDPDNVPVTITTAHHDDNMGS